MSYRQHPALSIAFAVFAVFVGICAWNAPAQAADSTGPLMLVAKRVVHHPLYSSSVLIVTPLPNGGHLGFIVNKPTTVKLAEAFPGHAASKRVVEPLFIGGPANTDIVFALVNRRDSPGVDSLRLAPDMFVAVAETTVDGIIEKESAHARFFVGAVVWAPGELDAELKAGAWFTLEPDAKLLLRKKTAGLYEEAIGRAERVENII